ncbi:MAG: dihydropteroate synthase [Bacteroidota bacterium]
MSFSLNCRGRLLDLHRPKIMGILNLTPDSFSDGGSYDSDQAAIDRVGEMLELGASIIDVGGYSSRPFADEVSSEEELDRIYKACEAILKHFPETILSIDTFRTSVAKSLLDLGAHIINDISAANLDPAMMELVAAYADVPYIMMHMQGEPRTMQKAPQYKDLIPDIQDFFVGKIQAAREAGIKDIVLDPGFGFGKSQEHNYQLLYGFDKFQLFDLPLLCGLSRKSMMYKFFDTHPGDVLEITTALHLKTLELGANIIRVHDIREANRIVQLFSYLQDHGII